MPNVCCLPFAKRGFGRHLFAHEFYWTKIYHERSHDFIA